MFEDLFKKGGLSLDRLRGFMQMALAGSIAKAAPDNSTRQSQISRQIRELEEFFGVELTQRRGKTLSLSPAGERLRVLIQGQLQDLEDFRHDQAGLPKTFTIGAGSSTLEWLVVPRLPEIFAALGNAVLRTELLRSRPLIEAVSDGRIDFAIVRKDAVPPVSRKNCAELVRQSFHLCVPKSLSKRGIDIAALKDAKLWRELPFAAGKDGGQMDAAVRQAMRAAGVDFKPRFECSSLLQVRQLVEQGTCAAVLPSMGAAELDAAHVLIVPFAPMSGYGRPLVLHWNPRRMRRRGVEDAELARIAGCLRQRR